MIEAFNLKIETAEIDIIEELALAMDKRRILQSKKERTQVLEIINCQAFGIVIDFLIFLHNLKI